MLPIKMTFTVPIYEEGQCVSEPGEKAGNFAGDITFEFELNSPDVLMMQPGSRRVIKLHDILVMFKSISHMQ